MSALRILVAASVFVSATAYAQEPALPEPVTAQPARGDTELPEVTVDVDREIDLANVVTSAAKGVSTVQEAPAIITIITAEDIKARGHKWLLEALATVPGWISMKALGNQVENPMVRGIGQAVLLMRDGMSLFEPQSNITWIGRSQPIETVKRIEVVTGPGGVLWGANSFMGIANLITKDAEDVNGLELSTGYGDGPGNKQDFKAYAMFGKTFLNGRLKIFQHLSYETAIGETFDIPQFIVSSPGPQPGGIAYWGRNAPVDPARSWWVMVDGKYTFGPVSLYYMVPFGDYHPNLTFSNLVAGSNGWTTYDRYGILEYKDRYFKDHLGITVKAFGTQFVRDFSPQLFPSSMFFPPQLGPDGKPNGPGGLHFSFGGGIFRAGGTVDLDASLPFGIRILAGAELFYEGVQNFNERFEAPTDPNKLPVLCPVVDGNRLPTCPRPFDYDTGRFIAAGYVDAQWRILNKVTLDGGVRIQKGFGQLPYDLVPLGSAAIVYNFLPDYHLKINYATGFRAPPFQDTSAFPGGVSYGSNRNLKNETSQAFQGELNARVLRNVRRVRELEVRVDYSYSVLSSLIQISQNRYNNTGRRGIHSAEGYAKLYLAGDHFLQASYTFLYSVATDGGALRNTPNHWAVFGGSFNIIKSLLDLNINLMIFGAYQDPNRYAASSAGSVGLPPYSTSTTSARTSDLTVDRLTPVADLQLGFRLRFIKDKLQVSGQFYNVLNQHYYQPDNFNELAPAVEVSPAPAPGFNFFANVSYRL
jgi:outer membrane receptor protein involved in Fe transport